MITADSLLKKRGNHSFSPCKLPLRVDDGPVMRRDDSALDTRLHGTQRAVRKLASALVGPFLLPLTPI